jgi:cyclic 2,3-diphosphoglycerate synthetase
MTRTLALVDGEHYPPTTRWALASATAEGLDVVACLFVGGAEKIRSGDLPDLGVPTERAGKDLAAAVRDAIARHEPELVLDLSDEPILGYRERALAAGAALASGVGYRAGETTFEPPVSGSPLASPTLAVIGTGKRTGKTAVAGEAARVAREAGIEPVIVAMGRGGPPGPQVVEAGTLTLDRLRELVEAGEHASSDYLEDAIFSGATTIGARRAGGGFAGRPYVSNVREAATLADRRRPGLVLLEGSGASVPPVPWDAGVLVCPARIPPEYLRGYLGPYRVLISDLIVFTMSTGPDHGPQDLSDLVSHVRGLRPDARISVTDFRPAPHGEVRGKKVYVTTTAPPSAGSGLRSSLEERDGCSVVGISHHLADRGALTDDLDQAPPYDVLLTEVKAAAIDVAAERALGAGAEVVFLDNRPETVGGDGDARDLLLEAARLAVERAGNR